MISAKELDDLKARVAEKTQELEGIKAELANLQQELHRKLFQYADEAGIPVREAAAGTGSPSRRPRFNQAAKDVISEMIGGKKEISIHQSDIEKIAIEANCTEDEVRATLKSEFASYPPGPGRKTRFGLKKKP